MPDDERNNVTGEVAIGQGARLVFSLSKYTGRQFANVRKFVMTSRYTGPTKSGFAITGDQLNELIGILRNLVGSVPAAGQTQLGIVTRSGRSEFQLQLVYADDRTPLPNIDIREHVSTDTYVGFTKKGIRFPWEKLPEVLQCFEVQLAALRTAIKNEATLFPEAEPRWTRETTGNHKESASELDELLGKMPDFPKDFLPKDCSVGPVLKLPSDGLELKVDREGRWSVVALSGYHQAIRNEVEGKFILYAQLRGHLTIGMPTAMINIFKAVAAYEKYCRELFKGIVDAFERKSKNRRLAEYQTRQLFQRNNLPIV